VNELCTELLNIIIRWRHLQI